MTAPFTIRKDMPTPRPKGEEKYPFAQMEVGDCFDAPRDMGRDKNGSDKRQKTLGACSRAYALKQNPTAKFTVRLIDENTVRCWRVA